MDDRDRPAGEPVGGKGTGPLLPPGYQPGHAYRGYPPYAAYPVPHYPRPSSATTVLVLGILSVALGGFLGFLGIIAWAMGNTELREIDTGLRPPDGRRLAQAGRICGIIGTGLFAFTCAIMLVWMVFFFGMAGIAFSR